MGKGKKAIESGPGLGEASADVKPLLSYLNLVATMFQRYCTLHSQRKPDFRDATEVFNRWLHYDNEAYEEAFAGKQQHFRQAEELWREPDAAAFWKACDLYGRMKLPWRLRFSDKARTKMTSFPPSRRTEILSKLLTLASGDFKIGNNCNVVKEGPCQHMVAFCSYIAQSECIVWLIQLHRLPVVRNSSVSSYNFHQHIYVLDFLKNDKQVPDVLRRYLDVIRDDPDKWILPPTGKDEEGMPTLPSISTSVVCTRNLCYPVRSESIILRLKDSDNLVFIESSQRWITKERSKTAQKSIPQAETYLAQINNKLLAQLADAESCQGFIRLLERIPNFRIKLTDQERELIGTPGNVLAIGRSGTGKTTCALLRLFASEVLFRFRSLQRKNQGGTMLLNTRFGAEDLDLSCGLHILFATASPVLTNEVKRFYWRLNENIKEELKRRNETKQKTEEEKGEEYDVIEGDEDDLQLRRQKSEEKDEIKVRTEAEALEEDPGEDEEEDNLLKETKPSLAYLRDSDFPLFLTIRRLVFMVDATLISPFFSRNVDGEIVGMSGNSEWHNEIKGVLMINREYKKKKDSETEADYSSDSSDSSNSSSDDPKSQPAAAVPSSQKWSRQLSFEVDYDYYARHFYPKIASKAICSAMVLWTEIVAYIKGSAESHKFAGWYLPKHIYQALGRKTSLLRMEDKAAVWELFIEYERWKHTVGAYDFQDVVNYQLYHISLTGYRGVPIHYMMIDEVQDLTHATLLLISKITEQNLFFSGDTAQTIAKGVGFRFCDLRSLFYHDSNLHVTPPQVRQLTVNFRSHGKILDLANSVVELIEAMFPKTIDKLAKERSTVDGPKPMVMTSQSVEELFLLLFGVRNVPAQEPGLLTRAPIEFGCDQVIIVRDQAEKERLPAVLKGALCLTVYETKGLEFDDVVLYNFFTQSEVPEIQWKIMDQLLITADTIEDVPRTLDSLDLAPTTVKVANPNFDDTKYSLLCTELKMLYVAITRPRKRLILFDSQTGLRDYVLNYWRRLGVVDELQVVEKGGEVGIVSGNGEEVVDSIASSTSNSAWRSQGIRMMKHRFYDQAAKCFKYSGDLQLCRKAQAYSLANEAAGLLVKSQQVLELKKISKEPITKMDRKQVRIDAVAALGKFREAGEEFEVLGLKKQAGKCYFSAKMNEKAAAMFRDSEAWGQCAEALFADRKWVQAGEMFENTGEYLRAIECYKADRNWEMILRCIHRFNHVMATKEKESLLKKYIPRALEELMPKVVSLQDDEYVYAKIIEQEEQEVGPKVIREDEEEEEESEEEPPDSPSETPPPLIPDVLPPVSQDASIIDISSSVDESSILLISAVPNTAVTDAGNPFVPLTQSSNPFDLKERESVESDNASSYSLIDAQSQSSDAPPVPITTEARFEMLSHFDPDDEWLQVETGSIVDSMQSAVHKDGSVSFDYSIFDNAQAAALNLGGQLITTRADIFVEDEIMRKVLQYISMFSEEVRSYLMALRSADTLTQKENLQPDWKAASMIDLDEVDIQLVLTVLDTLEYFQLYKLCLVVCNRYSLAPNLGRYVIALAHKYSSLPEAGQLMLDRNVSLQKEKAVIAYTALHNVFEMINPQILSPKPPTEENSLGMKCFQGMLLMGYWKKCVYLLDLDNALAIAATFGDYKNYKCVFLREGTEKADFSSLVATCFSWAPSPDHIENAILAIDESVFSLNQLHQITVRPSQTMENFSFPQFPAYAEFNESFWTFIGARSDAATSSLKRHLVAAALFIETAVQQTSFHSSWIDVRIHDCFSFLTLVLYASKRILPLRDMLVALSCEHFDMLLHALNACESLLSMRRNPTKFNVHQVRMMGGLLAPLGIRVIRESGVTGCLPLCTHLVVSRYSLVVFPPVEKMIPIDLEGDFFLCPADTIGSMVALEYVKIISEIVRARYQVWETSSALIPFDTIEELSKEELAGKTAACLFGESAFLFSIQSRYPAVFPLAENALKFQSVDEEENDLNLLERRLEGILALGEGDRATMKYVLKNQVLEIGDLEKQIKALKQQQSVSFGMLHLQHLFQVVLDHTEWSFSASLLITKTAKNWLLRYTQDLIKTIDYQDQSDRTMKMAYAYRIFSICEAELMMLDIIRIKAKSVLIPVKFGSVETEKRQTKVSPRFLDDLAWLDVQVYYRAGDWKEAARTIFTFLECQFECLNAKMRIGLIEKAVLLSLVSTYDRVTLPKYYIHKLTQGSSTLPFPVLKSDSSLLLSAALDWFTRMKSDLIEALTFQDESKSALKSAQTYITLISSILANQSDPSPQVLVSFHKLRNAINQLIGLGSDRFLQRLLAVATSKDLNELRDGLNRAQSRLLVSDFAVLDCSKRANFDEVGLTLDAALVSETRDKSLLAGLEAKIVYLALQKREKAGKLKLKKPPQILDSAERFGVTFACVRSHISMKDASSRAFETWKTSRAAMSFYQHLTGILQLLLKTNQRSSSFTNVLDRHHVLNQLFHVSEVYLTYQMHLGNSIETGRNSDLVTYAKAAIQDLGTTQKNFNDWTKAISESKKQDETSQKKKRWDARWKLRLEEMHAATGRKKQEYLQHRAALLKRVGRS